MGTANCVLLVLGVGDDICSCSMYCTTLLLVRVYLLRRKAPCLQRQGLDSHHRRLDIQGECHGAHNDTEDVYNVVSVCGNVALASAVDTTMLVWLQCAREGLRDKIALEKIRFRWERRWHAGGGGEHVHKLEDKETGECATEVGDPEAM